MTIGEGPKTVRVLVDVAAIEHELDYRVPEGWRADGRAAQIQVGSMVRVPVKSNRVAGWVTEIDPETPAGLQLSEVAKLSGLGPCKDVIDLARWASYRWAGAARTFLRAASPERMVQSISPARPPGDRTNGDQRFERLFRRELSVLRWPPAADLLPIVEAAVRQGPSIVVVPNGGLARTLRAQLARNGHRSVEFPGGWSAAAGGTSVVDTRRGVWASVSGLKSLVVIDEHSAALTHEGSPTWHAREVAVKRAANAGIPCVLVSPHPSPAALLAVEESGAKVLAPSNQEERAGWPQIHVVDRRAGTSFKSSLYSGETISFLRRDGQRLAILNRVGRSKLLACSNCDTLAACGRCGAVVSQDADGVLTCGSCHSERPSVCIECTATKFKNLRLGVTRAREELEKILREPVGELTAKTKELPSNRVTIGTEALLNRVGSAAGVAFLDFDQELMAPRYQARTEALAKLSLSARIVAASEDEKPILIQTRQPDHAVIQAAVLARPADLVAKESETRKALHLPPYGGLAEIAGKPAPEYVERLGAQLGISVAEVGEERFLVSSPDRELLLDALANTKRKGGRMRLDVDAERA